MWSSIIFYLFSYLIVFWLARTRTMIYKWLLSLSSYCDHETNIKFLFLMIFIRCFLTPLKYTKSGEFQIKMHEAISSYTFEMRLIHWNSFLSKKAKKNHDNNLKIKEKKKQIILLPCSLIFIATFQKNSLTMKPD